MYTILISELFIKIEDIKYFLIMPYKYNEFYPALMVYFNFRLYF